VSPSSPPRGFVRVNCDVLGLQLVKFWGASRLLRETCGPVQATSVSPNDYSLWDSFRCVGVRWDAFGALGDLLRVVLCGSSLLWNPFSGLCCSRRFRLDVHGFPF
jgi:hypothetical protein